MDALKVMMARHDRRAERKVIPATGSLHSLHDTERQCGNPQSEGNTRLHVTADEGRSHGLCPDPTEWPYTSYTYFV